MSAKRSGTPGPPDWLPEQLRQLIDALESIRSDMVGLGATLSEPGRDIHPSYAPSAANLLHYIALRRHDVRQILQRMQAHQSKKRSMLRRLHWWNKSKATIKP